MATDLRSSRPTPVKPSAGKYESYVEEHLSLARRRIRLLDVAAAGAGFLALTFAYGLFMALLDRKLEFSSLTRQVLFAVYAVGGAVYLYFMLIVPLLRRINPYYAARCIEATLPEAKNSVVSFLDMRQEIIPQAFRSAIGQKAAKDLAQADLEEAISARRASWLGGGAGALLVGLMILYAMSPQQFVSLVNRSFAPFVEASIATRTRLTLLQPEGGDLVIPVGRAVSFGVWVDGKIPDAAGPDALQLQYRYSDTDPYEVRPLEQADGPRQWFTSLRAGEVHNGFWYKITGGDAETPEYRVQVHSSPLLTGFDVTYQYRPYLRWRDQQSHDPNLQGLRGIQVTLVAHTNRAVKDGQLVIAGENPMLAELVASDPNALRFRLKHLEKDGSYRIWFTSAEGERNIEPLAYTIQVIQDQPPVVELKKPALENHPANVPLLVDGSASDDHGLASLKLHMRLDNGPEFEDKPYRKGQPLLQGDGSLPLMLDYKDFIELDKLKLKDGGVIKLQPLQVLEYWLEAEDNCDYPPPGPNKGESTHYRITIGKLVKDENGQFEKLEQVRKRQEQHEKKQDEQLKQQKQEPQPAPQKDEGQQDQGQQKQPGQDKQEPKADQQGDSPPDQPKDVKPDNAQQEQGSGQKQGQPSEDDKLKETAKRLEEVLQKQPGKSGGEPDKNGDQKQEAKENDPGAKKEKVVEPNDKGNLEVTEPKEGAKEPGKEQSDKKDKQASDKPGKDQPGDKDKQSGEQVSKPDPNSKDKQPSDKPGKDQPGDKDKQAGDQAGKPDPNSKDKQASDKPGKDQPGDKDKQAGDQAGKPDPNSKDKQASDKPGKDQPGAKDKQAGDQAGKPEPNSKDKQASDKPGKDQPGDNDKQAGDQAGKPDPNSKDKQASDKRGKDQPGDKDKQAGDHQAGEPDPNSKDKQASDKPGKDQPGDKDKQAGDQAGKPDPNSKDKQASDKPGKDQPGDKDKQAGEQAGKPDPNSKDKQASDKPGKDQAGGKDKQGANQDGQAGQQGKDKEGANESGNKKGNNQQGAQKDGQGSKDGKGSGNEKSDSSGKPDGKSGSGNQASGSGGGGSRGGSGPGNKDAKPGDPSGSGSPELAEKGAAANKDFQKKAGDMTLPKKIDKDTLKQLNMTDEDYQNFRKAYEEMLKRKAATPEEKEKLVDPMKGNRTMPNQAPRLVTPSEKKVTDKLDKGGPGVAPRQFRDQFNKFSRNIGEMGQNSEKK